MAERVLASSAKQGEPIPPPDVRPALEKLVAARRDLYVQLHDALATRISQLAELNVAERDLLNQTTQLTALLNSRLLWLPSSTSIGFGWLDQVRTSFGWIGDLEAWKATGKSLIARAAELPLLSALVLFTFGSLVVFSRRLFARLAKISAGVGRYSTDNYWRTPEALLISALLALKTPILFGYAGWLLIQPPQGSDFTVGVGAGLLTAATLLLVPAHRPVHLRGEWAVCRALRLDRARARGAFAEYRMAQIRNHSDRLPSWYDQRQQRAEFA